MFCKVLVGFQTSMPNLRANGCLKAEWGENTIRNVLNSQKTALNISHPLLPDNLSNHIQDDVEITLFLLVWIERHSRGYSSFHVLAAVCGKCMVRNRTIRFVTMWFDTMIWSGFVMCRDVISRGGKRYDRYRMIWHHVMRCEFDFSWQNIMIG